MKKIVLVNPPLKSKERLYKELAAVKINYPPLGLCYLAAVLQEKGYQVKILDLQIYDEDLEQQAQRVLQEKPDFIGMTATSVAIKNAAQLASELKKKTKAPIILGGPHITAVPEKTMEMFSCFDVGIVGEGEETLPELLAGGRLSVDGCQLTVGGGRKPIQDLDSLPLPAFDLLPDFKHYGGSQFIEFDERPTFRLVTSRGCPFNCRFCDKSVFGKMFRAHSPAYVMKMIKILYKDYGVRHIYFSDDTFTLDKKRIFELCGLLQKEKLDLTWDCNTRVDTIDPPLLKMMRKAGCTYIAYGIETGSQKILDILNKRTNLEQVRKACEETVQAGIKIRGNFMMGNPGETKQTIAQTLKFAKSLPLHTFKMSFFTPFPNTELYEEIDKWGKYDEDWTKLSKYSPVFVPYGFTQEEVEKYYKKAYFSFYFRPKIVFYFLSQLKSLAALKYAFRNALILSRFLLGKKIKKCRPIITLFVSLLIFALLFSKINIKEIFAAISLANFKLVFLACFFSILINFFWITDKWRRILKALGYEISYNKLLFARVGSYAIHGILPLKSGGISRIAYLKKFHKVPLKAGTMSVIIALALNILALLIFIAIGVLKK